MTRRALPLLVDALPLYATRAQLLGALASTPAGQRAAGILFAMHGFPPPSSLVGLGLYYTPSVLNFIEQYEANRPTVSKGAKSWDETSRRRG